MNSANSISGLHERLVEFRDNRDWQKFHKPKDLALSISIESAELLELYEDIIELEIWEVGGKSRHTLTLVTDEYVGEDRWESKYREDLFEQTPEQIIALVDEEHRAEVLQEIEQVFAKLKEISEAAA